jgi:hypothetical protein
MRILAILAVIALLFSCRKDDSAVVFSLPPATQTGSQTFGFKLDGAIWINYGQVCQPNGGSCQENLTGEYFSSDGGITINADQVVYKDGVAQTQNFQLNLFTGFGGEKTYSTLTGDDITVLYVPVDNSFGFSFPYGIGDLDQARYQRRHNLRHFFRHAFSRDKRRHFSN